jgi:predicted acyl esterase
VTLRLSIVNLHVNKRCRLRLHSTQEWHDLYQPDTIADLKKFLDFCTTGIANDWEQTPKARISVIRYNQPPLDNLPFNTWPIPQTERKPLYLSSDTTLVPDRSGTKPARFSYDSSIIAQQVDADPEELSFVYTFSERTTLIGPSKAVLFMSCSDHDDLDVFVMIRKADKNGKVLRNINIPVADLNAVDSSIKTNDDVALVMALQYLGPQGVLRASHRALDPTLSKHDWPAHDHTREEKVPLGEVVRLEIGIWPAAVQFEAGEKMVVRVSGHDMRLAEFEPLRGKFVTGNRGRHYLHVGGEYASFVEVPVVKV